GVALYHPGRYVRLDRLESGVRTGGVNVVMTGQREQAGRRLVTDHATECGGNADRSANVAANAEDRGARTDQRTLAAGAAARSVAEVVRVVRPAVDAVVRLE